MSRNLSLALALFAFAGCASLTLPAERLERTNASIRGAEELGAANVPAAKLHLQLARDQTAQAKKLADQGDARAPLVLSRADVDAELALGLAREAAVHAAALKAAEELAAVTARGTP